MNLTLETISKCPTCLSEKHSTQYIKFDEYSKHEFNIHLCASCALLFVNPRVSESQMEILYSDSYFHGDNWDSDTDYFSNYSNQERLKVLEKMYLDHYHQIRFLTQQKNPHIMDAGAGLGFFAQSVLKHYPAAKITCLDFSEYAVAHMKSKGLNAQKGLLQNLSSDVQYDAVYAREVIEHLYHPKQFTQKVYSILKNNGVFYYTTGNYDFIKDFKSWSYVRPIGHINYFNYKSMDQLLTSSGFKTQSRELVNAKSNHLLKGFLKWGLTKISLKPKELPLAIKASPQMP